MWDFVIGLLVDSVMAAYSWFTDILNSAPGAWDSIFTMFVILVVCRFLLGPLTGSNIVGGSDSVSAGISDSISKKKSADADFISQHKDTWDHSLENR